MKKVLSLLFQNVPKNHFKLSMKGYVATGTYEADGVIYETFVHEENKRIQLTVDVDTLEIVDVSIGRYFR